MPRLRWFAFLAVLSGAVTVGAAVSVGATGHGFLVWNLLLALAPVGLAVLLWRLSASTVSLAALVPLFVLWLLFLPNAPYLVTDLLHIRDATHVRALAFSGLVLSIAAATGVVAGVLSLAIVESAVRRRLGAQASRLTVALAIPLASFGVYLGRELRWNSWDALVEPWALAEWVVDAVRDPLEHTKAALFVLAFAMFLAAAYALYRRIQSPAVQRRTPDCS